jgi:hypothetical protein
MIAQPAVGVRGRGAIVTKGIAGLHRDIGVGVLANATGDQVDHFIRAGEFRVRCVHRLIENPQLHALAGVTGRIGLVSVDRAQPPLGRELRAAPTGDIPGLAGFYVRRSLGYTEGGQVTGQGAARNAMGLPDSVPNGADSNLSSGGWLFHKYNCP